ncbi:glycosyltransferase family 4 protein [Candidatus Clostridium stratigraminis]|uniref:Glycosyltransferase family 4 protein n=1 Tax=Candidatus Clostridium stratigraminis TaxID=3381661 RepID=A0ABW8T1P8_9CLOT
MRKKYVVLVGPNRNLKGGISTVINDIYNSDLQQDFNIIAINTYGKKFGSSFFLGIMWYFSLIIMRSVSICHIQLASKGSFYRKIFFILLTPRNVKLLIHVHGGGFIKFYTSQPKFIQRLIEYSMNKANLVITVSEVFRNELCNVIGVNKNKIKRVYNGVTLKKNINIENSGKEVKVLFMGKLSRVKGIYDFIEVIKSFKEVEMNVKFLIAGNGDIETVKQIIKNEKVEEQTEILGWIDGKQKDNVLLTSDVLIAPSYFESFGISIVEAMNFGVAIIGYRVGGIPEIVEHTKNGFLHDTGDISGMVKSLKELVENENLLISMKLNNMEKVKKFSKDKFIESIRKIYYLYIQP